VIGQYSPAVQQGFGDKFGTPSKVIRKQRKGYRKG
jgi:hypothetical protein